MCSSPKDRSSRPRHLKLDGLTSGMDYADYSKMVQRANESYEKCQYKKDLRKQNPPRVSAKTVKKYKPALWLSVVFFFDVFKKVLLNPGH